mmetsp:Transcript_72911/g.189348  ORF Transcript_72911/g.189348 Transcript_72911/m.189348 type:complete len:273 (-) Transcript_72911:38-856(-)
MTEAMKDNIGIAFRHRGSLDHSTATRVLPARRDLWKPSFLGELRCCLLAKRLATVWILALLCLCHLAAHFVAPIQLPLLGGNRCGGRGLCRRGCGCGGGGRCRRSRGGRPGFADLCLLLLVLVHVEATPLLLHRLPARHRVVAVSAPLLDVLDDLLRSLAATDLLGTHAPCVILPVPRLVRFHAVLAQAVRGTVQLADGQPHRRSGGWRHRHRRRGRRHWGRELGGLQRGVGSRTEQGTSLRTMWRECRSDSCNHRHCGGTRHLHYKGDTTR